MQKVLVKVTQENIDKGNKDDCSTCPVALAFSEALGIEPSTIKVRYAFVSYKSLHLPLPEEVTEFIENFDDGQPVKPFEFELEIPEFLDNDETIPKI